MWRDLQDKFKAAGFRELTVNGVPQSLSSMFSNDMELIRIFVQDEMIAQDYASYMTYFYTYSISSEELRYLNKVFARTNDEEQSGIAIQPDFCRKMSVKYPSIPVITRFDGFVILSDFHSVFSKIKVFKKIFWLLLFSMY